MNIDKESIDRLLALDDASFRALARSIAEAAGVDKRRTEVFLNNSDVLKSRLAKLTPQEAEILLESAGREKSVEIARILRERGVDIGR